MSEDALGLRLDRWKPKIDALIAAATVLAAVALILVYWSIKHQERVFRLQLTQAVLDKISEEHLNDTHRATLFMFEGRWTKVVEPMSAEEAHRYFEISKAPDDSESTRKWNAARRHLNLLEEVAFAYVSGLADKDALAAASCRDITRSYKYFAPLIREFTGGSSAHGWSVIERTAELLEIGYGSECEKMHP